MFGFTACAKETNMTMATSVVYNKTEITEGHMEDMSSSIEETGEGDKDREYLINLTKQLNIGMDMDEVFFRLGDPDFGKHSSSMSSIIYNRGEYTLCLNGQILMGASVINNKTGEEMAIDLSIPQKSESDTSFYDESDIISLGKQIELGMTEQDVIDKLGEPNEKIGSELNWFKYHYGNCTLYIDIWKAKDKVYRVRVYNYENNNNIQICVSDEPIVAE